MQHGKLERERPLISSDRISVVVQGPIVGGLDEPPDRRVTYACLASVRQRLPKAEIVLSTWQGSDVAGLPYDVLVTSEDPGAVRFVDEPHIANNVNRQIVSTRNGLRACTRPYALKLRADMLVTGCGFADYFGRFEARSDWSFVGSKVIGSTLYARVPGLIMQSPYHPSDWFFFGRTEDVLAIWDIPLAPEPETTRWLVGRPRPANDVNPRSMNRYVPEQYIWLSFLRKNRTVRCEYMWDLDDETIHGTEISLASNLILLSPPQAGLILPKYNPYGPCWSWREMTRRLSGPWSCYSHAWWRYLYDKHCVGRASAPSMAALAQIPAVRATARIVKVVTPFRQRVGRVVRRHKRHQSPMH